MVTSNGGDIPAVEPGGRIEELDLIGGEPSLDFVNTGSHRASPPFKERLHVYADLVTWAERVCGLDAETSARLRGLADRSPEDAQEVVERGRRLREAIYRSFTAMMRSERAAASDLDVIAAEVARASAHRRLVPTVDGCEYEYTDDEALERPLWPVALNAAELATSSGIARVKECASENCNWLFFDASKNRSRRWCDMKDCGNRAKARRHRARTASS